ncbi:hypothetical protein BASA81_012495 [Batrachochytrium salamandrivorans]|nr:hypothetical protein BASA81_012495 [Batrachochytrium salamandrivorans]
MSHQEAAFGGASEEDDAVFVQRPGEAALPAHRPQLPVRTPTPPPPLQALMGEADALLQRERHPFTSSSSAEDEEEEEEQEEEEQEEEVEEEAAYFEEDCASPPSPPSDKPNSATPPLLTAAAASLCTWQVFFVLASLLAGVLAMVTMYQLLVDVSAAHSEATKWYNLYLEMEERNYQLEIELHRALGNRDHPDRPHALPPLPRTEESDGEVGVARWAADSLVEFGKWATAPENSWSGWAHAVRQRLQQ